MREFRRRRASFRSVAQIFGAAAALACAILPPAALAQEQLTPGSFKAYAANGVEPRLSNFSGLPVPRYSSLRFDTVNGRAGPSADYPVRWTYERAGLPVVIVRESNEWRKIRDPMGDEVWVNKSQLAEQRTAITTDRGVMQDEPGDGARAIARFAAGAVVRLKDCGTAWCRVEAQGQKGWVARSHLWGADPLPSAVAD